MKSLLKLPPSLMSAIFGAALLAGSAWSQSEPDNPPVNCGCCECYDFESVKLTAGDTEVSGDTTEPSECTKVSPNEEGQISLELELPPPSSTCADCDQTTLKVRLKDAEGKDEEMQMPGSINSSEWKSPITLTINCVRTGESQGSVCRTFKFCFGDCERTCDSCPEGDTNASGAGEPEGGNGSVHFKIPVGKSNYGSSSATLEVHLDTTDNPGPSALKLRGWDGIPYTIDVYGAVKSVTTQSCHAEVAPAPTSADPSAYTVSISSNPANPSGSVFRTVTIEELASGAFQMKSQMDGVTRIMQWTKSGNDWTFVSGLSTPTGNGLRKIEKFFSQPSDWVKIYREKLYELDPDNTSSYLLVSDEIKEYHLIGGTWKIAKSQKDPDGANLVSTWTYYEKGQLTGPSSYVGVSQLKDFDRYDGYFERHSYWDFGAKGRTHLVQMPYGSGTMTRSTSWDPDTGAMTVTDSTSSGTISKTETFWSRPADVILKTVKRYTSATQYLTTVYSYHQAGSSGIGNKLKSVARPDGTSTIYGYSVNGNGHRLVTEDTGAVSAGAVTEGTRQLTRINPDGNVEEELVSAISAGAGNGTILRHWTATAVDTYGRPTTLAWYPLLSTTWNTTRTYACCGIASETDNYGILTQHQYDMLRRRVKTNRLGVTEATKYAGLTVSGYRYPETVSGGIFGSGLSNEISRSVSNLAGTVDESWGPSPQTGALVKLSTATTTYRNPVGTLVDLGAGIGSKIVKEVIQVADDGATVPKQSSLHYFDGNLYRSWGDLEPAVDMMYTVTSTGPFTRRAFVENISASGSGGTLREAHYTYKDYAGRLYRRRYLTGGGEDTFFYYNTLGQLNRTVDGDGVNTRYAYNSKGERTVTARKLDATTSSITWGSDRITSVETVPATRGSSPTFHVLRTITKVWKDGDTSATGGTIVSTLDRSTDGLRTWSSTVGVTNEATSTVALAGGGDWTVESVKPDQSKTLETYLDGLWDKTEEKDSSNSVVASTSARDASHARGYDNLNRPTHSKDSRTGVTETQYLSAISDVVSATIPPAGAAQAAAFSYDHRGRRTAVDAPQSEDANAVELDNITVTKYWPSGSVKEVSGEQAYPVTYTYDYAGRMLTMTTSSAAGAATTRWLYSTGSGLLTGKYYNWTNDATVNEYGPSYTYTAAGRLLSRSWAREVSAGVRLKATYGYTYGLLTSIDYNDSTPDVAYNYNAFPSDNNHVPGSLETVTLDGATWSYRYNGTTLRLESETHPIGGTSGERVLTRSYDAHGRSDGFDLGTSGDLDIDFSVQYGFDTAGRLNEVTAADKTFTYGYTTNGFGLVETVDGPNGLLVTNTWESDRDVLAVKKNEVGTGTISQFTYGVNDFGQRTGVETDGTAFSNTDRGWAWGYDALGQVTNAVHTASPATLDRTYGYDDIGNRTSATDGSGGGATTVGYTPDKLNQYSAINPGTAVNPVYDLDGNLKEDAGFNGMPFGLKFEWDAENRLTAVRKADDTLLATYKYDHLGRRIRRTLTAAAYSGPKDVGYIYDGWNVVTEYLIGSGPTFILDRAHTWGLDLSGSLQGAGGVGGLLCINGAAGVDGSGNRIWNDAYYPTYDGNGNVSEYLDKFGAEYAHFEYDPFGRLVHTTGAVAGFSYRFSTKPWDMETGLYYYGYRYYDPVTGRWPSRDPIEEKGGLNLYGMVGNSVVSAIDLLGLAAKEEDYSKMDITSKCACPLRIKGKSLTVTTKAAGRQKSGIQMDFRFTFELLQSDKAECQCIKVRAIQMSGRFNANGDPAKIEQDGERGKRTVNGWRIDWNDAVPDKVPWMDNFPPVPNYPPVSNPWTPGNEGTVNDPPEILKDNQTFKASTCFVGIKKDGSQKFLGCLHWGAKLTNTGRYRSGNGKHLSEPEYELLDGTPSFSCDKPDRFNDVAKKWNDLYPDDVHIPIQ